MAAELSIDRPGTALAWELAEDQAVSAAKLPGADGAPGRSAFEQMKALGYLH